MKPETANFEESKNIKWTCKSKYIKVNLIKKKKKRDQVKDTYFDNLTCT